MKIKRVHAADMQSALDRIRAELGPDAVIISTRPLGQTLEDRRRGLRGVEVVAGVDELAAVSIVAQARSVAQGLPASAVAVAPGAARAAYTLAAKGAGGTGSGERGARSESDSDAAAGGPTPLPGFRGTVPGGVAPARALFPRVEREDDPLDLDKLAPALQALAARKNMGLRDVPAAGGEAEANSSLTATNAQAAGRSARTGSDAVARVESHEELLQDSDMVKQGEREDARPISLVARRNNSFPRSDGVVIETPGRQTRRTSTDHGATETPAVEAAVSYAGGSSGSEPRNAASAMPVIMSYVPPPARMNVATPAPRTEASAEASAPPSLIAPRSSLPATPALIAAEQAFELLSAAGLADGVAEHAIEQAITVMPPAAMGDSGRMLEVALARLIGGLPEAPALSPRDLSGRVVFFTGPAGVGKTTALLKAAMYLRRSGADVGIVGADVSRLGATEHMLRYGALLQAPAAVAYNAEDLRATLAEAPDGRTTLVDTAAFTPGDSEGMAELHDLIAAAPNAVVVLTVAAGSSEGDLRRLAATAREIGVDALALTKLDEADEPGIALNVVAQLRLPPILCSTGRDVLADIETISVAELAVAVLEAIG
ncbi:MAG: hypothetical protein HYX51_04265 [Chloroflexi bacterium]|nr:hypothetical protein [Chloroflexota bacterium]